MKNRLALKKAGLKITGPRLKILKILEENPQQHMSAEKVYRFLLLNDQDIGLATVYRVLTQLEACGLIIRHHFEGGNSVFELNEGMHHDHLVCIRCGQVNEFQDEMIEERQRFVTSQHQFEMTDHDLTIYGICKQCKKSSNSEKKIL